VQDSNLRPSASETEGHRSEITENIAFEGLAVPARSQATDLRTQARAILVLAAGGDAIPGELAGTFARRAIIAGIRGDLALPLIDGAGAFGARVVVELAVAVMDAIPATVAPVEGGIG
jgi:hypothetical protein